ncbi:MAG: hypothetical protein J0I20_05440 [Chloroflexi bacterium]|nr:hypothetical protein [Chloroflexota bacterium]OJV90057.1 MAG: hypothetical protein BGO39_01370 [Chloroflexi bacterium 54-19]
MQSYNLPPNRPSKSKKPNKLNLNLIAFGLVGLTLTAVSYQVGHEVASQLPQSSALSQQSGQVPDLLTPGETPAPAPATPTPAPGSVPLVDTPVALIPPTTRPGSQANPVPTATVPPPAKKAATTIAATAATTRPVPVPPTPKPATPKAQALKPTPKPVPTTKAS